LNVPAYLGQRRSDPSLKPKLSSKTFDSRIITNDLIEAGQVMGEGVVLLDENLEPLSNLGTENDRDLKLNRLSGSGEIVLDSRIDGVKDLTKIGRREFVGGCSTFEIEFQCPSSSSVGPL
jgi:hypothetical protein